jgi:TolB-like protein
MKKRMLTIVLVFAASLCFGQQVPKVVVPTFEVRGGYSIEDAETITELFRTTLDASGKVIVLDRNSTHQIMNEMGFQISDWSNDQRAIQMGQAIGASIIVRGQLSQFAGQTIVTATMLDANSMVRTNPAQMQVSPTEIFNYQTYHHCAFYHRLMLIHLLLGIHELFSIGIGRNIKRFASAHPA